MSVETAALAAPPVAQGPPQPGPLRFLLVEDNPVDVQLMERGLRRAGFDFTSAVVQTPEDFTRELRVNRPHVVLADTTFPIGEAWKHWKSSRAKVWMFP